ncbi:hypothetical protein BC830DRAFT_520233 [Chytriomyces sp. MP71]|nr:hypothetical protein BC830DRAFT_520233 [Chytriomyces sp. MP71]
MSITSDERRSANASNLSVNFLQEVAELQSTLLALQQQLSLSFSGLQNQISVGVARVNKLLEMGAKISGGASNMTGHEAVSPSSSGSGSFSIPEHSEGFTMDKARTLLHRIPERPSLILTGRKVDIETPTVSSNSMAVLQSPTDGRSSIVLPESGIHSVFSLVIQEQHDRYQYHDPDFFPDTSPLFPAAAKLPSFEGGNRCLVKSNTVKAFQTLPIVKVNRLMSEEVIPKIPAAKANAQLTRINKGNASRQSERSQLSLGVKWDSADYNEDCDTEPSNESGLKRSKSASYDTAEPPVNTLSEPADSTRLGSGDRMSFFKLSQASSIGKFVGKIVLGNHFDDHVTNADTLLPPQQPERNMQRFFQPNNLSRQQSGNRQPHSRRNSLLSPTDDDGKQSRSPLVQISYGEDPDYRGKQMHRDDVHVRQPDSPPHERVSVTSRSIKDASSIYSTSTSHASNGISIKVQILEDPHEEPLPTPPTPEFTERDSKKPSIQTYTTEPELKEKNATSNWWSRLLFASMYEENDFQERSTLVESIQNRSLFTTGIHPLSPVAAIVNLVTTQGYFVALFFIPYRAAFYDPLNQVDSGLQWSITVIFVIDSVFNFFVPPLTKQTSDRPVPTPEELNIWQIKYSKQYLAIDILSMVPWGEIVRDEAILFPLEILCLIRAFRLPSKILQNPFFKLLHVRLQNIVGIGNVLSLLLAIGVIIVIFLHIQACILYHIGKMNGFFTWENQFSHWSHYPGGLKSAPAGDRYIFMLTEVRFL